MTCTDLMGAAAELAALLSQDTTWTTTTGSNYVIADMTAQHCHGALRFLELHAGCLVEQTDAGVSPVDPAGWLDWVMDTPLAKALRARVVSA